MYFLKGDEGKNGRCKHYGYCYEALTDKVFLLTVSGYAD